MEVRSEVTFLVHMLDFILWQWLDLCQIKQTGFYKMKEIQTWNWQLSILDKKKKYSSPKTFEILKDNLENVFEFLLFLKLSLSLFFTLILFSFFHSFLSLSFSQSLFLSLSHFSSLFSSVFFFSFLFKPKSFNDQEIWMFQFLYLDFIFEDASFDSRFWTSCLFQPVFHNFDTFWRSLQ